MASSSVCTTFWIEIFTNGAVSNGMLDSTPRGSSGASSAMRSRTADAVRTAFAPGRNCTPAAVAGWPSSRVPQA